MFIRWRFFNIINDDDDDDDDVDVAIIWKQYISLKDIILYTSETYLT